MHFLPITHSSGQCNVLVNSHLASTPTKSQIYGAAGCCRCVHVPLLLVRRASPGNCYRWPTVRPPLLHQAPLRHGITIGCTIDMALAVASDVRCLELIISAPTTCDLFSPRSSSMRPAMSADDRAQGGSMPLIPEALNSPSCYKKLSK